MAVLVRCHLLFLVGALGELGYLAVNILKGLDLAADGHVVGLSVEGEVGAEYLRVIGLVHLKPLETALGGVVDALGALEICVPIPLLAKCDGVLDLLCCVVLHVVLAVTQGGGKLEHGDAVLKLKTLGDNAVAEQRAVAGGVALDGAGAEHGRVVVDGDAGFCLGHRADVARKAVFLRDVDVMLRCVLVQKHGDVGGRGLAAKTLQGREAHHDGGHLVFIDENDLVGELLVVADAAVAAEETVKQLCDVLDYEILLQMADAQMLAAQPLRMTVDHHGDGEVVCHPAVAEHGLDVSRLRDHLCHGDPVVEPAGVIIERVHQTAPLAAVPDLALSVEFAEILAAYSLIAHHLSPPWIFFISMLSTKACTRVRIWPEDEMLYGRSTDSTG